MNTPRGRVERARTDPDGLDFRGLAIGGRSERRASIRRLLRERRYGSLLASAIRGADPDVVLSANCPLDAQAIALSATQAKGGRFVHWCQDVYSEAVGRLLGRQVGFIGGMARARFARLERDIFERADEVVLIAEEFRPFADRWRSPARPATVIQNWAPVDEIEPMPKVNTWSRRHAIGESLTFLYAGTLGRKHDPNMLVTLAEAVPTAQVLVASEGSGTDRLAVGARPPNLRLLPMQQADDVPPMLASADVLVALLEHDAGEFSVPSKVLTYLSAGRPILAAIPSVNRAARTIVDAHAGIVVEPGDRRALTEAAQQLASDPELRAQAGDAGRRYAVSAFEIEAITDRFEAVLSREVDRSPVRAKAVAGD
jgi:colanic acid biosynthesis glycosyl transferase WcaI